MPDAGYHKISPCCNPHIPAQQGCNHEKDKEMSQDKDAIDFKRDKLFDYLQKFHTLAVGFSGGVDSTLLVAAAKQVLGDRVIAMTAQSPTHPQKELDHAAGIAEALGVRHIVFQTHEMEDVDFTANGPERCYHCKKILFGAMRDLADGEGLEHLAHGANLDDISDHRPGFRAAEELGVTAPLIEAGLTKQDIRHLAQRMGLPNWNRPAMACLATRVPYGEKLAPDVLRKIEQAESMIMRTGVRHCRVRHHGNLARIEIDMDENSRLIDETVRQNLIRQFRSIGYQFVCLDLEGYLSGKMNREL